MSDGFVARLDSGMAVQTVTYLGTSGTDRVDSLAFMDGALYAGGRTDGTLGAARIGATDGFVARIDAASGTRSEERRVGKSVSVRVDLGGRRSSKKKILIITKDGHMEGRSYGEERTTNTHALQP